MGIDGTGHRPQAVTPELVVAADVVVAMEPGLDLPQVPGVRYETWSLPDPARWDTGGIRPLREAIDRRVQALITELMQEGRRPLTPPPSTPPRLTPARPQATGPTGRGCSSSAPGTPAGVRWLPG